VEFMPHLQTEKKIRPCPFGMNTLSRFLSETLETLGQSLGGENFTSETLDILDGCG